MLHRAHIVIHIPNNKISADAKVLTNKILLTLFIVIRKPQPSVYNNEQL